jgi:outer membrane lipoprotein SlyB
MWCRLAPLLALMLVGCAGHDVNARSADSGGDARACQSIRSAVLARDKTALTVLVILCK